jgi:hypothetical protein
VVIYRLLCVATTKVYLTEWAEKVATVSQSSGDAGTDELFGAATIYSLKLFKMNRKETITGTTHDSVQ